MSNLDDLEIDPLDPGREDAAPFSVLPSRPSWAPLGLLAVAIAGLGAMGWYAWQRARPAPTATVAEAPAAAASAAPAAPVVLPPLEQMDPFVRTLLSALSSHPQLLAWLASDDLLGSMATAIDRLAQGRTPARDLAVLKPGGPFAVITRRGVTIVDPASFARYDAVVAALASVDPDKLAAAYLTLEPRLQEAYARQGHAGSVRDAVQRAAATVVATPDTPEEIQVVPKASGYGYADPRLEALPSAQKQLLRMGPVNVQRVRDAVRQFAAAVAAGSR